MKTYTGTITHLEPNQIFVFGSNTQGRHGKGAAKTAMKFGAIYGQSSGLQGQTYAIITKNLKVYLHPSISSMTIITDIVNLYRYAILVQWDKEFLVAYHGLGTNLNGYTAKDMAYMFWRAGIEYGQIPDNIVFEKEFARLVELNNASVNHH